MAFNPFSSFRKYQKFWIPGLLLVCMVSFIMCSGNGGEQLFDNILYMIRGESGDAIIHLEPGGDVRFSRLDNLKKQRLMANIYMRESTRMALTTIESALADLKKTKDKKEAAKQAAPLEELRGMFINRLKEPNYFETGTKLEDLAEFILWQKEADKLGVQLVENDVRQLTANLLFRAYFYNNLGGIWGDDPTKALAAVQHEYREASFETVNEALRQEYRVKIAQLSLTSVNSRNSPAPNLSLDFGILPRLALSPQQLEKMYRDKLTRFTVALLPVPVERFVNEVKEPSDANLADIFKQYQASKYDPAQDNPGFWLPEKLRVSWVTADPKTDYYQNLAKAMLDMEVSPPVHFDFGMPGFGTVMRHAAGQTALEKRLREVYGLELRKQEFESKQTRVIPRYAVRMSPTSPHFILPLVTHPINKPTPVMAATLVGGASVPGFLSPAPSSYQLRAYFEYSQKLQSAFAEEAKNRTHLAVLPLGTLNPFTVAPLANWEYDDYDAPIPLMPLPLVMVEDEIRKILLDDVAAAHAKEIMFELRKTVPKVGEDRVGNQKTIDAWLTKFYDTHARNSLTIRETDKLYTRFDIDKAPELQDLVKIFTSETSLQHFNYMAGRTKQDKGLKDADFSRLFFDASEDFSAGSASNFVVKEWPPVVTIPGGFVLPNQEQLDLERQQPDLRDKLDDMRKKKEAKFDMWLAAPRPVLFWKSDYQPDFRPESFKDMDAVVRHAWKVRTARDEKALPAAEDLAATLEKKLASDWSDERKAVLVEIIEREIKAKNIDLKPLAKDKKIDGADKLSRDELIQKLLKQEGPGVLERAVIDAIAAERKFKTEDAETDWNDNYLKLGEKSMLAEKKVEALKKLAAGLGTEPIFLDEVSAWNREERQDFEQGFPQRAIGYSEFQLPKDRIPYARKDTVDQLLTLGFRKSALKIDGDEKATKANKKLFDNVKSKPNLPAIQLIANQPRSVYYVAIILDTERPSLSHFMMSYRLSEATMQGAGDPFVSRVYMESAKVFRNQFEEQMRAKAQYKVLQDKHGFD